MKVYVILYLTITSVCFDSLFAPMIPSIEAKNTVEPAIIILYVEMIYNLGEITVR